MGASKHVGKHGSPHWCGVKNSGRRGLRAQLEARHKRIIQGNGLSFIIGNMPPRQREAVVYNNLGGQAMRIDRRLPYHVEI